MTQTLAPFCAAVDWGTSSFRLWLLDEAGALLAESRGGEGMMHCASGPGFQPVLDAHLAKAGAPADLPVVICGMAGARQGWLEAPYVAAPAALSELPFNAARIADATADIRILPGISLNDASSPNVMRGEETQLLGTVEALGSALVCMPGTHSKWVRVEAGAVTRFSTFMTGELFSVLTRHAILQHAVDAESVVKSDDAAFLAALERAIAQPDASLSGLFGVRAAQLLGYEPRDDGAAHLSGLLIGGEVAGARSLYGADAAVTLIASGGVSALYETALARAGFTVTLIDAETASRNGLYRSARQIWDVK
ncbi:2-dehydro-3-deoxygalactonokinase [Nitratireductor aquibiodomus]|uniref:2-dehydro-3-deoxygalactonokinase n=1 Tax=Nitratireductor aquibiodomus TaxID=204799 RepID=UPI0019D3D2C0|nr:2-dehydro-3-deoxygalactonokinase [Nitratireductor aquibiodomus]MBN7759935.1 2-dehydro-3-deoxygalactonokinase [Nitratireductor aquibiodomus]